MYFANVVRQAASTMLDLIYDEQLSYNYCSITPILIEKQAATAVAVHITRIQRNLQHSYRFISASFFSITSCSVTALPCVCLSTSFPSSRTRPSFCPISETNTPFMKNGYEPTRTPSSFTRSCSSVRYGAIEDSGRLQCDCQQNARHNAQRTQTLTE